MKNETKMIANTICLPVLRDLLEDCVDNGTLRFEAKKRANEVIRSIDNFSKFLMQGIESKTANQAVELEIWFRNELKKLEQ